MNDVLPCSPRAVAQDRKTKPDIIGWEQHVVRRPLFLAKHGGSHMNLTDRYHVMRQIYLNFFLKKGLPGLYAVGTRAHAYGFLVHSWRLRSAGLPAAVRADGRRGGT